MSELTLRSVADFALMLAFAAAAGTMLIGGAVIAVALIRGAYAAPAERDAVAH